MLAAAVAAATDRQRAVLDRVGEPDLDDGEIAAMQSVIVDSAALAEIESRIASLADEAVGAVAEAPITASARADLVELAQYVVRRAS